MPWVQRCKEIEMKIYKQVGQLMGKMLDRLLWPEEETVAIIGMSTAWHVTDQ